jgi:hypothetical protein
LGSDWTKLEENILGEFGWKEVLKQFLGEDRAKTLAAAWDGDRYVVYEHKRTKRLVLVSLLRLNNTAETVRFFGQYSEALEKKYDERSKLLRRPNFFSFDSLEGGVYLRCLEAECLSVEGTTRAVFDGTTKAIGWPASPEAPLDPAKPAGITMTSLPKEDSGRSGAAGIGQRQ